MTADRHVLLCVIAEASLEAKILATLVEEGVSGYTLWDARGAGSHGERPSDWEAVRNVCIQSICRRDTAERVQRRLEKFHSHWAIVSYVAEVEVRRTSKF